MIFKSDSSRGDLNGFLDAGSHMRGELHFDDTFRVDGKLTGKVISEGDLVIGERGEVEGELEVGRVFISGIFRGTIKAARRIEVTAGGRLLADIDAPALVLEEGAFFEGRCAMPGRAGAPKPEASPRAVVQQMPISRDGQG